MGTLVTVHDIMTRYRLGDLTLVLTNLSMASRDLFRADDLGMRITEVHGPEYFECLALALDALSGMCLGVECDPSLIQQIDSLKRDVEKKGANSREAVVQGRLRDILEGVQNNLESRAFMYMPAEHVQHFDNPDILGSQLHLILPKAAASEAVQAGNCFAAELYTACVFHCMRVAEFGLRKLAKQVGAKITDKGKPCKVEYATWDKVIVSIRGKITSTRQLPAGAAKSRRLDFYSFAADHCEYMKDIWRNEVSHTRRQYTKSEAKAVLDRVRGFVSLLASLTCSR